MCLLLPLQACQVLDKTPGRSRPPPTLRDVLWFSRDALNIWHKAFLVEGDLPLPPDDVPPFPVSVLGRFAAKYYTHTYMVFELSSDSKSREEAIRPDASLTRPKPWQDVEEWQAFYAAGYDIDEKDKYLAQRDAYLVELVEAEAAELAAEESLEGTSGQTVPESQPFTHTLGREMEQWHGSSLRGTVEGVAQLAV